MITRLAQNFYRTSLGKEICSVYRIARYIKPQFTYKGSNLGRWKLGTVNRIHGKPRPGKSRVYCVLSGCCIFSMFKIPNNRWSSFCTVIQACQYLFFPERVATELSKSVSLLLVRKYSSQRRGSINGLLSLGSAHSLHAIGNLRACILTRNFTIRTKTLYSSVSNTVEKKFACGYWQYPKSNSFLPKF